ncbi:MAG: sigma 54-interacting transcriptional regulator [Pseudomonadota bacterium]
MFGQREPLISQNRFVAEARVGLWMQDQSLRGYLARCLKGHVHLLKDVTGATAAESGSLDVLISDVPPSQSLGTSALRAPFEYVLVTPFADLDATLEAEGDALSAVILKPFREVQVQDAVRRAAERGGLRNAERNNRRKPLPEPATLMGNSDAMKAARSAIARMATGTGLVMLKGPTGVGRRTAARMLRALSDRPRSPFVELKCASHQNAEGFAAALHGAGAALNYGGAVDRAAGGFLYLNGMEYLSHGAQDALWHWLERRGLIEEPRIIVSATPMLDDLLTAGAFRADLFHKLNVLTVDLPPLAARPADIGDCLTDFLHMFAQVHARPAPSPSARTVTRMHAYSWPGNLHELRTVAERAVLTGAFPPEFTGEVLHNASPTFETLAVYERRHIEMVLANANGNVAEAARRLGISRKTIDRKLAQWRSEASTHH